MPFVVVHTEVYMLLSKRLEAGLKGTKHSMAIVSKNYSLHLLRRSQTYQQDLATLASRCSPLASHNETAAAGLVPIVRPGLIALS
jgi:hypothetical protein